MSGEAVEVFFSYSHKDEALRDQLATHLKLLERQGIIAAWHDRKIVPGSEWAGDIHHYLERADIILLLVSADFLASDYCWDIEIQKALERHEAGTTTVIPVILRPVDWSSAPFARLQALPKNAQPVVTWMPPDLAFMDIAKGIRLKAEELVVTRQAQAAQTQRQAALEDYRQRLKGYLAAGPLSFIVKENLNDLAQTLGLSQADTAPIEAEETALQDAYRANLERYGETFRRALDHEYPLGEVTKAHLQERQTLLNLNAQDVQLLEQTILADWQALQLQNQRQQEQEAAARFQREQEAERLRSEVEAERLRQKRAEAERQAQERREQETTERLRQEQEAAAQRQREQEAERLRSEAEAERLRQQQVKAERQAQERQQRETAERLRQQQTEAQQQEQERKRQAAAERQQQRRAEAAARRQQGQTGISRRRVLQIAGFGGGGLLVAVAANSLSTATWNNKLQPLSSQWPTGLRGHPLPSAALAATVKVPVGSFWQSASNSELEGLRPLLQPDGSPDTQTPLVVIGSILRVVSRQTTADNVDWVRLRVCSIPSGESLDQRPQETSPPLISDANPNPSQQLFAPGDEGWVQTGQLYGAAAFLELVTPAQAGRCMP